MTKILGLLSVLVAGMFISPPIIFAAPKSNDDDKENISQIKFTGSAGIEVRYDVTGQGQFDSEPVTLQDFPRGAIYRLKLTHAPGRPGKDYYPTLEVAPTTPRTEAFLANNAIPVQFTVQDFDQVQSGNFVTKVIYLPDTQPPKLSLKSIETLVSTRLDPGVDPIREADRRGAILAIVRLGNTAN